MANLKTIFYKTLFSLCVLLAGCKVCFGVIPVKISSLDVALDLSSAIEFQHTDGKTIQVTTVPGRDGVVHRIEVQSNVDKPKSFWGIFALVNTTNEQIDRLIVAPHYRLADSGILHPNLGAQRIYSITPSEGFALTRQASSEADVFRVTINPGSAITFVAELSAQEIPKIYLWQPDAYKDTVNSYTLYHGILLGIAGLLALLLSVLFIIRSSLIFPATAAFAWAVLFYIGLDFHFLDKILTLTPLQETFYRSAAEIALVVSLSIFLFAYLNLKRWHYQFKYGALLWWLFLLGIIGLWFYNPVLAASIARIAFGVIMLFGLVLIVYFAIQAYDFAIMLIPTWFFIAFWTIVSFCCIVGYLNNDILEPALAGGLVLIVLMLAFTIMNQAFTSNAFHQGIFSDVERQALAVMGSGDIIWDWDVKHSSVSIIPDLSSYLGAAGRQLSGNIQKWLNALYPEDRDRFRAALRVLLEKKQGKLEENFRLRASDSNYYWFKLRARPVLGAEDKVVKCIGTLVNITDYKKAEERLLYDATHDNLTKLPNKTLLLDRLNNLITLSLSDKKIDHIAPALLLLDFNDFRKINDQFGRSVGDNFLLIIAQRLKRLLKPYDTLARLRADRFAILLSTAEDLKQIASFAQKIVNTTTTPVKIPGEKIDAEIKLSVSIGLVTWASRQSDGADLLNDAELALLHAKKQPGNHVEVFYPRFRSLSFDNRNLKKDFHQALARKEIRLHYQPILRLKEGKIVGFEVSTVWDHRRYGLLSAADIISATENSDFLLPFAQYTFEEAAKNLAILEQQFPQEDFFISINFPSSEILQPDFINEIKNSLIRYPFTPGRLLIELSESALVDNPEQTYILLNELKQQGFSLAIDNFGSGYASLLYFIRFPFDMVKLDRSLLMDTTVNKERILKSIIRGAKTFDLKIAAEGVETEKDVALLRQLGCQYMQSTAVDKATDFKTLVTLIEKDRKRADLAGKNAPVFEKKKTN